MRELLLLSGDVETNPGFVRKTKKERDAQYRAKVKQHEMERSADHYIDCGKFGKLLDDMEVDISYCARNESFVCRCADCGCRLH
jgi:hypothetical protein